MGCKRNTCAVLLGMVLFFGGMVGSGLAEDEFKLPDPGDMPTTEQMPDDFKLPDLGDTTLPEPNMDAIPDVGGQLDSAPATAQGCETTVGHSILLLDENNLRAAGGITILTSGAKVDFKNVSKNENTKCTVAISPAQFSENNFTLSIYEEKETWATDKLTEPLACNAKITCGEVSARHVFVICP